MRTWTAHSRSKAPTRRPGGSSSRRPWMHVARAISKPAAHPLAAHQTTLQQQAHSVSGLRNRSSLCSLLSKLAAPEKPGRQTPQLPRQARICITACRAAWQAAHKLAYASLPDLQHSACGLTQRARCRPLAEDDVEALIHPISISAHGISLTTKDIAPQAQASAAAAQPSSWAQGQEGAPSSWEPWYEQQVTLSLSCQLPGMIVQHLLVVSASLAQPMPGVKPAALARSKAATSH